ncbi:N-acetylneuraminate synthase [Paenibacillus sp. R14(2021)]|uniref:N-acetylneuraminate synthase n=1 Tax=Paenibacillus sp. R14(2021) TaxID=2859228 RepID=UPI001C61355F|nr:N-acetylneuraminate synthase [Paenibacillus sp. R14(2021)]
MTGATYIIAEAGVNHNGSIELAKRLVEEAAKAGANAVKFQTFQAAKLVSSRAEKAEYQKRLTDSQESQLEMIRRLELSLDDHVELIECCRLHNIDFLSTPFDDASLVLLTERLRLPRLKFSSGDLSNLPLLLKAAQTGCELIVSTGMATLGEVEEALSVIAFGLVSDENIKPSLSAFRSIYASEEGQQALRNKVTLLHCTTEYPTPYEDVHLNRMLTLEQAFGLPAGYSDHTLGTEVSVAAVALGAKMIEKHFTLDKTMEGPDHQASLEPQEIQALIKQIRHTEAALGTRVKYPAASELKNMTPARKSIVASRSIQPGEAFDETNLTLKRPGNGLSPSIYWEILGRKANRSYEQDELIEW